MPGRRRDAGAERCRALAFSDLTPTTVMTGNVTQLVIDLVDLLRGADASLHHRSTAPVADPRLRRRRDPLCLAYVHAGSGLSPCHWPS